jgi:hypothetical protein
MDMKSETLHNIRTMRQVKTSLEVAGRQRIRTTNSLSKSAEEIERLESIGLDDSKTDQVLARERARAAKFEASVDRSQRKMLRSRDKIAGVVNRNRALTGLRHQIQHERDLKKEISISARPLVEQDDSNCKGLRNVELKY